MLPWHPLALKKKFQSHAYNFMLYKRFMYKRRDTIGLKAQTVQKEWLEFPIYQ